jgi:hypothetical protein
MTQFNDDSSLQELFAQFDEFVAARPYLQDDSNEISQPHTDQSLRLACSHNQQITGDFSIMPQPIGYYTSNRALDDLTAQYGDRLEKVTPLQKCLIGCVLFDHLANDSEYYGITESLNTADPDCLLGEHLSEVITAVADVSYAKDIASLLCALASQVAEHVRTGEIG